MHKKDVYRIESVAQHSNLKGLEMKNPLISAFRVEDSKMLPRGRYSSRLYSIFNKQSCFAEMIYGRRTYDFSNGTLIYLGPEQIIGVDYPEEAVLTPESTGWGIVFDKELLIGTEAYEKIDQYPFFSYQVNEALHLSKNEKKVIDRLFEQIVFETESGIDSHTRKIISDQLILLLDYSMRYYQRQFDTRAHEAAGIEIQFKQILQDYYSDGLQLKRGTPSVSDVAEIMGCSASYLSDKVKRQTGRTPQDFIASFIVDKAKSSLHAPTKSVKEVAVDLGFDYPNHFTRFFKDRTGETPSEFRKQLN